MSPLRHLALVAAVAAAPPPPAVAFDHDHAAWTRVLQARVRDGQVDYGGLRRHPADLTGYLRQLERVTPQEYSGFSRDQRLAFWINAYNAYTVRLVLDHYPVASIRKIGRIWQSPFRLDFIPLGRLLGRDSERTSLDDIEHGLLRREFREPLIHAALVCAATSCPRLASSAYTAAGLRPRLEQAMRDFLADRSKNRWDGARRTLELSPIFRWFDEDFVAARGSVQAFVLDSWPAAQAHEVRAAGGEPAIEFLDYDWSLNGG